MRIDGTSRDDLRPAAAWSAAGAAVAGGATYFATIDGALERQANVKLLAQGIEEAAVAPNLAGLRTDLEWTARGALRVGSRDIAPGLGADVTTYLKPLPKTTATFDAALAASSLADARSVLEDGLQSTTRAANRMSHIARGGQVVGVLGALTAFGLLVSGPAGDGHAPTTSPGDG